MRGRVEFFFFRLVTALVLALPLKVAQRMGALAGSAAYYLLGSRRRIALDNLAYAFPGRREQMRIARGAFRNYGITMMEFLSFPKMGDRTLRRLVRMKNIGRMIEGHAQGKGLVMLSGHFGNWELIALATAYFAGLPLTIIVQTQSNRYVDRVINRYRCLLGNRVVPMGMSVRETLKTLRSGGVVAIAPDQSGPMEGVFVDFFGRSVATHQGPAALCLRTGAPMQIGFIIRGKDGTYDVVLEDVPSADLAGDSEENIVELTRRHTAILERYVRAYPDHWLWMHRRWKHTAESVRRDLQRAHGQHA